MKKTTVTITCDGHRYANIGSACDRDIDAADEERCLAVETTSGLTFIKWDDDLAQSGIGIKHFHTREHAANYLQQWLEQQSSPVIDIEYPEVAPAPAFDPGPVVVTPILAGQQTGDEPQF